MKRNFLTRNFIVSDDLISYLIILENKANKVGLKYNKELLEKLFVKLNNLQLKKEELYSNILKVMVRLTEDFVIRNSYIVLEMIIMDEEKYDLNKEDSSCTYLSTMCDVEQRCKQLVENYCDSQMRKVKVSDLYNLAQSVKTDTYMNDYIYIELVRAFNISHSCDFIKTFTDNCGKYAYDYILKKREEKMKEETSIIENEIYNSVYRHAKFSKNQKYIRS